MDIQSVNLSLYRATYVWCSPHHMHNQAVFIMTFYAIICDLEFIHSKRYI